MSGAGVLTHLEMICADLRILATAEAEIVTVLAFLEAALLRVARAAAPAG
jgi:hypothetical protein